MAQLLSGNRVRDEILAELKPRVERLAAKSRPPGLAVILVGNDPASHIYVRNKIKACAGLGINSDSIELTATVTTRELLEHVHVLNQRPDVDGILVQLPLPKHVDSKQVLLAIAPDKDADGIHPFNVGCLVAGLPAPRACTPAGIIEILKRYGIPMAGRRAVVVGRSDIVGKPVALLLLHENATVTICHSKTADLPAVCRDADILVAAIGRAGMITREFLKPGVTVVDVGTNRVDSREEAVRLVGAASERIAAFDRTGSLLVGDCNPVDVAEVSGSYTPVPGGVGPLTIAMLMMNTVASAERRLERC